MTLVVDAAAVVAMHDRNDPWQARTEAVLRAEQGPLVIPAPVTAEIDYLLASRLGEGSRQAFMEDLAAGRYEVACLERDDFAVIASLETRYADMAPGLADLAVVLLASRYRTDRIATFDERHFRAIRRVDTGGPFTLLPIDGAG